MTPTTETFDQIRERAGLMPEPDTLPALQALAAEVFREVGAGDRRPLVQFGWNPEHGRTLLIGIGLPDGGTHALEHPMHLGDFRATFAYFAWAAEHATRQVASRIADGTDGAVVAA